MEEKDGKARNQQLLAAIHLDTVVTNGVATTADGRIFLAFARFDGCDGPRIVEWTPTEIRLYPDATWNSWTTGQNPAHAFVRANSLGDPEGDLWIVDVGSSGIGNPKLPHGSKLVQVYLASNIVQRVYNLEDAANNQSFILLDLESGRPAECSRITLRR